MTKYCKLCGKEIDSTTRKCTGCGKQYFRPVYASLVFIYIALLFSTIYYFYKYTYSITALYYYEQSVDEEFVDRFGGYTNPDTGEEITGWKSYLDALDAQMKNSDTNY